RVSASGGPAIAVTELDAAHEYSHRWPWFLPDGKHFLYLALAFGTVSERGHIYVGTLGSKERKLLVAANSSAEYSTTGHLLYCRDRTLIAQRVDVKRLEGDGERTVIADNIFNIGLGGGVPALS